MIQRDSNHDMPGFTVYSPQYKGQRPSRFRRFIFGVNWGRIERYALIIGLLLVLLTLVGIVENPRLP